MKNFTTYILEKLKLTKDTKPNDEQHILDFLNSRFCDFDNDYEKYTYTIEWDNEWCVDVKSKDDYYKARSNYPNNHTLFEGLRRFNNYVKGNPKNEDGWKECPEFKYRDINCGLSVTGWQHLSSLEHIEHIHGNLYLEGCITRGDQKIKVDNLTVDGTVIINSAGFQIKGYKPEIFFDGKIKYGDIRIV